MRHDFDAIPEAAERRDGLGSMLTRIYHDIGLAAVADALGLLTADFEGDLAQSIERGEYYLLPIVPRAARIDMAA
jgi:hypothetical protein